MSLTPVLSLWQPWATALFIDLEPDVPLKPDETRHWPLPASMVGRTFVIHAAKRDTKDEREFWEEISGDHRVAFARHGFAEYSDLPRGALIGTVVFHKCMSTEEAALRMGDDAYDWGNYGPGRYAYRTINRRLFKTPIPFTGRQGIFSADVGGTEYRPL